MDVEGGGQRVNSDGKEWPALCLSRTISLLMTLHDGSPLDFP